MSDNQSKCFNDICEITSSKRIFYSEYVGHGIPFYRSKEIIELANNKVPSTELFISEDRFSQIAQKFGYPQSNDILLTSVGTLGQVYLVDGSHKFYFKDGNLTWFRNWNDNVFPKYIYHWLRSKIGQQSLMDVSIGSTQAALTIAGLKTIEIPLPPLPEQQAIAEVLSSIDDKIDLLHRNNKTLEEMAETLFRQWFVEGAKEEWEEVTIGSLCTRITKGTTPTTLGKNFKDSGVSFIKAESIEDHGGFVKSKFAYIDNDTHDLLLRSQLEVGDVLYTIAGTIGRTAIVTEDILPANTNQAVAILKADTKKISNLFLKYLMKSDIITDVLESKVVHAVQPNLSLGEISSTQLKMPTTEIMKKFNETAENISMKINSNIYELTNLVGLRDLLLPKLMSGQVRVNV